MRDVNRIYNIMNLLQDIWLLNPDLRFTQILELVFKTFKSENIDLFYVDDEEFAKMLEDLLIVNDFEAYGENN